MSYNDLPSSPDPTLGTGTPGMGASGMGAGTGGSSGGASGGGADAGAVKYKATVAKDAVRDLASEVGRYSKDQFYVAKNRTTETVQSAQENVVDYVTRKPYQSLAIAAGIGFVARIILKRR